MMFEGRVMVFFFLLFTCSCVSSMAPGLRSDSQLDSQRFALIIAGMIHRGIHHIIDGVHETGHVL